MKVFLNGGGADIQAKDAYKKLNQIIDHSKPCLYIPLAMKQEKYDGCYEWITGELRAIEVPGIDMVRSAEELSTKNLNDYSFLFIGGGNTFKLLHDLKTSGSFEKISEYINNDGIVFGGSAGAIIFGKDLEACKLADANEVNLQDINGFDILNGMSILCHYTNGTPEKDEESKQCLLELSQCRTSVALPEEVTLFVNGNCVEVIGNSPYYLFENGQMFVKNEYYRNDKMQYNIEFWNALDELVNNSEIIIDRPKGTSHPKYPNFVYRVDYGYLKDTTSMDGAGIDVWVGSGEKKIDAIMCIVDLIKKDSEIKILIGCTEEEKKIVYETHNETQFMKGILIRRFV